MTVVPCNSHAPNVLVYLVMKVSGVWPNPRPHVVRPELEHQQLRHINLAGSILAVLQGVLKSFRVSNISKIAIA